MDNRSIRLSKPEDAAIIEQLHDAVFGPGRFARTAYRVREQAQEAGFGLIASCDGVLAGSVHFTPVTIGGRGGAMMLGPLAVASAFKAQGFGRWLVEEGVKEAQARGTALVILVGDLPYYARMGFERIPPGQITLPGPVAPERLLARELREGARATYHGLVAGDPGWRAPSEQTVPAQRAAE
jgi:predicted N-acetyltransferase YhbS